MRLQEMVAAYSSPRRVANLKRSGPQPGSEEIRLRPYTASQKAWGHPIAMQNRVSAQIWHYRGKRPI